MTGKNRQKISKPGQEIATEEKTDGKKKTKASATGKKKRKKKQQRRACRDEEKALVKTTPPGKEASTGGKKKMEMRWMRIRETSRDAQDQNITKRSSAWMNLPQVGGRVTT